MAARHGHFDKSDLYSTVRNTSGKTMTFGFLPPHGASLAPLEEYSVFGNILSRIGTGPDSSGSRRHHQAFAAAIDRGDITIVTTPTPIFKDTATGAIKRVRLTSGSLAVANVGWLTSDSDDALDVAAEAKFPRYEAKETAH